MAVTREQVLSLLLPDEPDYERGAAIGPDAIPHLVDLVMGEDIGLAMKAAHLAGRIHDPRSRDVLLRGSSSPVALIRVAAASAARHMPPGEIRDELVLSALGDVDRGVRKFGLLAAQSMGSSSVRAKVLELRDREDDPALRSMAGRIAAQ